MIDVRFDFFDREFHKHEFAWECQMGHLPQVGDEIYLPDQGVELVEGDKCAVHAIVDSIVWHLGEDDQQGGSEDSVAIYCHIAWETVEDNPS